MILSQDPKTGYWNRFGPDSDLRLRTHKPEDCEGRLCDVHNRRGEGSQATWPLNWRTDRAIMEFICPCGIGHPTRPQEQYWRSLQSQGLVSREWVNAQLIHGCCMEHCA